MHWYRWPVLPTISCQMNIQKSSPFFLMFGRDPVLPLNTLLEPKIRYMGNDINILLLETMKNVYEVAATNLKLAHERRRSP